MTGQTPFADSASPSSPTHYKPCETALLLLDWHKTFIEKVEGAKTASDVAAALRNWAKQQGIEIVHALIDSTQDPFPTCKDADTFKANVAFMEQSGGIRESANLTDANTDVVHSGNGGEVTFTRTPGHVSALKSPGLVEHLRAKGIRSLLLTGLSTSGCVARTALAATDAEFVVTVVTDACAEPDQAVHDVMINKVLSSRNFLATAAEARGLFQ